ncbi:glutaredoxin family protein [Streptomyces sp. AC602_WCS936]|uniref:glutaredoxin family protein n=1 Tax=Streptomyces sp. AC602_WCS936 TaxID=2823685 RepID=UPI001C276243|nr:glutaredoxin family protein [Streptomyces sp. AC602_WCS936]
MAGMSPLFRRKPAAGPQAPQDPQTHGAAQPAQPPEHSENHLVTLIRKPGCHLCDDAQLVVEKVCADLGVPWEGKDITEDRQLHDEYWEQIPVVLVDGRQHTFWRVNEERLRKALTDQYK